MRRTKLLAAATACLMAAGCMHSEFVTDSAPGRSETKNNAFFFWGLVGANTFDAAQICPEGVHKIDTYYNFGDGFLYLITVGIYAPRTVEITCAQKSAGARIRLNLDQGGTIRAVGVQDHDSHWQYRAVGAQSSKLNWEVP